MDVLLQAPKIANCCLPKMEILAVEVVLVVSYIDALAEKSMPPMSLCVVDFVVLVGVEFLLFSHVHVFL